MRTEQGHVHTDMHAVEIALLHIGHLRWCLCATYFYIGAELLHEEGQRETTQQIPSPRSVTWTPQYLSESDETLLDWTYNRRGSQQDGRPLC